MQAILITAYKDRDQLQRLINFFEDDFLVYIHLDKKSKLSSENFIINKNVKIIQKYSIKWGGINHLYAILDLLALSLKNSQVQYIHIISGQDVPIKSIKEFKYFDNCNKIFMESENLKNKSYYFKRRVNQGSLFSNVDSRKNYIKIINKVYGFFRSPFVNKNDLSKIWIGLVWCSFPRNAAEFVQRYVTKREMKYWKHILIPEEFFFQTIFENSKLKNNICKNNLRYNDWHNRNGSIPAILDENDFTNIKKSNDFFARKIDTKVSQNLIELISKNINSF